MQIFSIGENLHEMSKPVFWEKYFNMSIICWKFYPGCAKLTYKYTFQYSFTHLKAVFGTYTETLYTPTEISMGSSWSYSFMLQEEAYEKAELQLRD